MANLISSYLKWVAKLNLKTYIPEETRSRMAAAYANTAGRQNALQLKTRSFLDQIGTPVGLSWGYQAAASEAEKKKRQYSGLTLQNELNAIVAKWASKGLNAGTLTTLVQTIA